MKKIQYLEGLRGVAALIVIVHHMACAFFPSIIFGNWAQEHSALEQYIYTTPVNILFAGNFAVCVFFVLSGFVLSYSFLKKSYVFSFKKLIFLFFRRYLRLMVPILTSVYIAYLLLQNNLILNNNEVIKSTYSYLWLNQYYRFHPDFSSMLYQGTIGIFMSPNETSYNNVLWAMYYEYIGSCFVYIFLMLFKNNKYRYIAYLLFFIVFLKTYYLAFLLGILLYDLYKHSDILIRFFSFKFNNLIILITIIVFGGYPIAGWYAIDYPLIKFSNFSLSEMSVLYHILGAVFLIGYILYTRKVSSWLSTKYLSFIGRISFSLYLLHPLVIFSFSLFIYSFIIKYFNYNITALITILLSIILIIPIAYLFYKYIDQNNAKVSYALFNILSKT